LGYKVMKRVWPDELMVAQMETTAEGQI
jgi:hypothetical protein